MELNFYDIDSGLHIISEIIKSNPNFNQTSNAKSYIKVLVSLNKDITFNDFLQEVDRCHGLLVNIDNFKKSKRYEIAKKCFDYYKSKYSNN